MKAIINIKKNSELASIQFKKGTSNTDWADLTKDEQEIIIKSLASFYSLFAKFIKEQ